MTLYGLDSLPPVDWIAIAKDLEKRTNALKEALVKECEVRVELVIALKEMLEVNKQLMPGISKISCSNYRLINMGPIHAHTALVKAEEMEKKKPGTNEIEPTSG